MPREMAVRGECTAGCGACCRRLVLFLPSGFDWMDPEVRARLTPNHQEGYKLVPLPAVIGEKDRKFLKTRGCFFPRPHLVAVPMDLHQLKPCDYGWQLGQPTITVKSICPRLNAAGCCELHGLANKPEVCVKYPLPGTKLPDGCTYRFEEVDV